MPAGDGRRKVPQHVVWADAGTTQLFEAGAFFFWEGGSGSGNVVHEDNRMVKRAGVTHHVV